MKQNVANRFHIFIYDHCQGYTQVCVYMRTSGKKVRISDEAERGQSVSYTIIVRVIHRYVFKGRQARHLPPSPF